MALVLSDSWLTCCSFLFPFPLFSFSPSIITIYISSCFSPICGTLLLICFVHAIRFLCFSPCLSFLPSILFFFISVTSFHFLPLLFFLSSYFLSSFLLFLFPCHPFFVFLPSPILSSYFLINTSLFPSLVLLLFGYFFRAFSLEMLSYSNRKSPGCPL